MDRLFRNVVLGAAAIAFATISYVTAQGAATLNGGRGQIEAIVKDYLTANPEILVEMQGALERKQTAAEEQTRLAALTKIGQAALTDPKVAFTYGPEDAKVTVVEFFDYRCGFCKASLPAMKKAVAAGGKVRFAFVEFPILSADSLVAAQAAVAARAQPDKYVPFHLALMETTGDLPRTRVLEIARNLGIDVAKLERDMASEETRASLQASHALAEQLNINGTPTFIINGKFHVGQIGEAELTELLKDGHA